MLTTPSSVQDPPDAALPARSPQALSFANFRLDIRREALTRDGHSVDIPHQALQLLMALVKRPGQLVTREALQQELWPDRCVEFDQSLNNAVRLLRRALQDDTNSPRFVATVPRRGYRFIADVSSHSDHRGPKILGAAVALLAAIAVLVMAVLVMTVLRTPDNSVPPPAQRTMLAVLPFDDYSASDARYFADGLTEDLIAGLAQSGPDELGVIARTSSMQFRGTHLDAREIGDRLGVDYLLEGSSRVEGDRVRVVAQLIKTDDASHVWARTFDDELSNTLELQRQIAAEVSNQLELKLVAEAPNELPPIGSEAYLAYLRGRDLHHHGGPENIGASIEAYRQSLALAPDFALALNGLARALISSNHPKSAIVDEARSALDRAIELNPRLADAWIDRARVALFLDRDFDLADKLLQQARMIDRRDVRLLKMLGYQHVIRADFERGLAFMREAVALDPLSAGLTAEIGLFFMKAGDLGMAQSQCEIALGMGDAERSAHRCLVHVHLLRDDPESAWEHARQELRLRGVSDDTLESLDDLGAALAMQGYWRELLAFIASIDEKYHVTPYWYAIFHAQLGEKDRALSRLQETLDQGGAANLVFMDVDPRYRTLWGDPRFEALRDHVMRRDD